MAAAGGTRVQGAPRAPVPETLPQNLAALLHVRAFSIRAATVPGLAGADGLGRELKNAADLLDFNRVPANRMVIIVLTLAADRVGAALRRHLT